MYNDTGTRLFRTSWATWDAIWPRSARRFLRASSRFFSSSSSFSRATSAQSVSCVRSSRSVAVVPGGEHRFQVGVAVRQRERAAVLGARGRRLDLGRSSTAVASLSFAGWSFAVPRRRGGPGRPREPGAIGRPPRCGGGSGCSALWRFQLDDLGEQAIALGRLPGTVGPILGRRQTRASGSSPWNGASSRSTCCNTEIMYCLAASSWSSAAVSPRATNLCWRRPTSHNCTSTSCLRRISSARMVVGCVGMGSKELGAGNKE